MTKVETDFGDMSLEIKLGWLYDWSRRAISTNVTLGGVGFTTETPRVASDGAQFGLGVTWKKSDRMKLKLTYDGNIRSGYTEHTGTLKLVVNF